MKAVQREVFPGGQERAADIADAMIRLFHPREYTALKANSKPNNGCWAGSDVDIQARASAMGQVPGWLGSRSIWGVFMLFFQIVYVLK